MKELDINFFRYISICSMIYEEIFNTSFLNSGVTYKENQSFLDDLSNKNNSKINQIILQINLLNFENKIIYIIGEFIKYKNKALCQLFPVLFRHKQLLVIKNKLTNSNSFENWRNEDNNRIWKEIILIFNLLFMKMKRKRIINLLI